MSTVDATIDTWTQGDYAVIERWLRPASLAVLDAIDFASGPTLLDVACGVGTVAIEAASRGAQVTGLDLTPAMLEQARRRALAADVSVRWIQGSFDQLDHLGTHDVVTSTFGVVFAANPESVARQLAAVCNAGGRIVITSWHEDGAFGGAGIDVVLKLDPDMPLGSAPDRWSNEEDLRLFFAQTPVRLEEQRQQTMYLPFDSVPAAFDELVQYSGPWKKLMEHFASIGKAAPARTALEQYLASYASPTDDGGIRLTVSYVVSTLVQM